MRAAACARLAYHARQVVRAVTQYGNRLFVERRQNKLAFAAVGHRFAGFGIDDFPKEVVLGDMLHVARRKTFARNAGSHDLGEAVVVGAHDVHARFDFLFELRGARLSAEQAHAQRTCLPVEAEPLSHLAHMHGIRRRGDEHRGSVILDHGEMPLGIARTGRNQHASEFLQSVVQAESACEHAVAEGHLRAVARHNAGHLGQSGDAIAPYVHIMGVVADYDGFAGCARRGVKLDDLVKGHGEQAVWKRFAQNRLIGEGKQPHIFERLDVARLYAALVELVAIPSDSLVGPCHLVLQLRQLDLANALP